MRVFPIAIAAVVIGALYLVVFERDRLLSFARGGEPVAVAEDAAATEAGPGPAVEEDMANAVKVVAMQSQSREIDGAVIVRGRTEAARQIDVRAETSGLVVSNPIRRGTEVAAGDLLCRLDIGIRDAALAEAESRLAEARARVIDAEVNERAASRLSEGGFASETRLTAAQAAAESARAGVLSAEAVVASANKELDRLEIRAPFGGILETDTAELGALLQPGSVCATVIQLDPMKLVGFVPEVDIDRIDVDAPAGARLATGREVLGTVTFLSRSADETTRTFRVDVEVSNADNSIRDGQTAEIFIASDGEPAHLLPQSALTLNDAGRMGVRTVVDGRAAFEPVSIVRDTTEGIWVTGLAEDVSVIVVGQEFVTDGVAVDVTLRETDQ